MQLPLSSQLWSRGTTLFPNGMKRSDSFEGFDFDRMKLYSKVLLPQKRCMLWKIESHRTPTCYHTFSDSPPPPLLYALYIKLFGSVLLAQSNWCAAAWWHYIYCIHSGLSNSNNWFKLLLLMRQKIMLPLTVCTGGLHRRLAQEFTSVHYYIAIVVENNC